MTGTEKPYKIHVSDEEISLLKQRLKLGRFPDEVEGAGWDYGAPLADMKRLAHKWGSGEYDWRKEEKMLNDTLPQFTRDIEIEGHGTLNVHYIHKRSNVEGAIPLLFVHGWPGSFFEAVGILPLLVEKSPNHPSFHVVTYSLPGFGFSEAPKKPGFEIPQFAELGNKLMLALGYNEYVTQAGDWGHVITRRQARLYGHKHVKAWHSNFPLTEFPHPLDSPLVRVLQYSDRELEGIKRTQWYQDQSSGYFKEQSTQPQTLGYSLADSPLGLLGWFYEKLIVWTDQYPFTDDEILTWVSIYWFSRAGPAASLRIYHEVVKANPTVLTSDELTTVPMGYSYFPKELICLPRRWLKADNLVFEAEHDEGGHFAAFEKPEKMVGDLRRMFGKGGPAYGVVSGKDGY